MTDATGADAEDITSDDEASLQCDSVSDEMGDIAVALEDEDYNEALTLLEAVQGNLVKMHEYLTMKAKL